MNDDNQIDNKDALVNAQFSLAASGAGAAMVSSMFTGFIPSVIALGLVYTPLSIYFENKYKNETGKAMNLWQSFWPLTPGVIVGTLMANAMGVNHIIDLDFAKTDADQAQVYEMNADEMHKPIDMKAITVPTAKV